MPVLILLGLIGLSMAIFATQNMTAVTITVASFTIRNIPIYFIVIASFLLGIFISWFISLVDNIGAALTIHGKDTAIKNAHRDKELLEKKNRDLEIEIARLKGEKPEPVKEEREEYQNHKPDFFHRLKHSIS